MYESIQLAELNLYAKNSSSFYLRKILKADRLFRAIQSSYLSCSDKNLCLELTCNLKMYRRHLFEETKNLKRGDEGWQCWKCSCENESTLDNRNSRKVICKCTKSLLRFMHFNYAILCRSVVWLEPWKINGACSKNFGSVGRASWSNVSNLIYSSKMQKRYGLCYCHWLHY